MSLLFQDLPGWTTHRRKLKADGNSIGFVPTMGALHGGHLELIRRARRETDCVVVSVFLNPTQFNNPQDFEKYPRTLGRDRDLAEEAGADVIFAPQKDDLYPDGYTYKLIESKLSNSLEGEHRPGHFDGVLTVVMKLFNLVQPSRAYFGEKDYQQLQLVEGMVDAFFLDVKIVPCETVREADGLAMSSRNSLLTPEGRGRASALHRTLAETPTAEAARQQLISEGFTVEYVEDRAQRRLGAVVIDNVRLIDNVALQNTL